MSVEITDDGDILLGDLSIRELKEKLQELKSLMNEVKELKKDIEELKSKKNNDNEKYNQFFS